MVKAREDTLIHWLHIILPGKTMKTETMKKDFLLGLFSSRPEQLSAETNVYLSAKMAATLAGIHAQEVNH